MIDGIELRGEGGLEWGLGSDVTYYHFLGMQVDVDVVEGDWWGCGWIATCDTLEHIERLGKVYRIFYFK